MNAGDLFPAGDAGIVHLGLGAFHRAHQAWYTHRAADAERWGIVAFSGRSRTLPDALAAQDMRYSVVERAADGDTASTVGSLRAAFSGERTDALDAYVAHPAVSVVTMTITEAGYGLDATGRPDLVGTALAADVAHVRAEQRRSRRPLQTALGRLLGALAARRADDAGPLTIVPCDNLPGNGPLVRRALIDLAEHVSTDFAEWMEGQVAVVSTSVDRITPRLPATELPGPDALGWHDAVPVVTEPFSDWVIAGAFAAARPDWASAGARLVADVEPWEQRKLWLLNGAHTLLAAEGRLRGWETVHEAMADPACRSAVEAYWRETSALLPADLECADYCAALTTRFDNSRIAHRLAQIAADELLKARVRLVPVAERVRASGGSGEAALRALGAVVAASLAGPGAERPSDAAVADRLGTLSPRLRDDDHALRAVRDTVHELARPRTATLLPLP